MMQQRNSRYNLRTAVWALMAFFLAAIVFSKPSDQTFGMDSQRSSSTVPTSTPTTMVRFIQPTWVTTPYVSPAPTDTPIPATHLPTDDTRGGLSHHGASPTETPAPLSPSAGAGFIQINEGDNQQRSSGGG